MTPNTGNLAFNKLRIQGVRSMRDTFYWINETLEHHIREFQEQPEILSALSEKSNYGGGVDLIERLETLREDAEKLYKDIKNSSGKYNLKFYKNQKKFKDFSPTQVDTLRNINTHMRNISQVVGSITKTISETLDIPLENKTDKLWDYKVDVEMAFILREDDAAFSESSDNFIAKTEPFLFDDNEWADGYEDFILPHCDVFHDLYFYGGFEKSPMDYEDMERIGSVWVDVIVRHQYLYDLTTGKWIKKD